MSRRAPTERELLFLALRPPIGKYLGVQAAVLMAGNPHPARGRALLATFVHSQEVVWAVASLLDVS